MAAFGPLAAICLGLGTVAAEALGVPTADALLEARRAVGAALAALGLGSIVLGLRPFSGGRGGSRDGRSRRSPLVGLLVFALLGGSLFGAAGLRQAGRLAEADRDADRAWRASVAVPAERRVEATVTRRVERTWGTEVELAQVAAADRRAAVPTKLRLRWNRTDRTTRADALLWPGARVVLAVRIRPLLGTRNPGSPDRTRAARRRGLAAEARLVEDDWVLRVEASGGRSARLARARAAVRRGVRERLQAHGAGAGLAAALAVGDRRGLAGETREALRALGLGHLIAVSGLHVGLVGLGAATLVRWLFVRCASIGDGRRGGLGSIASGSAAIAAAWGYGWLTGAAPAALRAALALSGAFAARALARPIGAGHALGWAACGLLLVEPALVFDLGAQLSFAACFGLLRAMPEAGAPEIADPAARSVQRGDGPGGRRPGLGSGLREPISHALRRGVLRLSLGGRPSRALRRSLGGRLSRALRSSPGGRLSRALRLSLGASFATAPIVAAAGWPLAVWGPVLNLVALPVTAVAVLPAALIAAVAARFELTPLIGPGLAVVAGFEEAIRWTAAGLGARPSSEGPVWSPALVLVASVVGLAGIRRTGAVALLLLWLALAAGEGGPRLAGPAIAWPEPPRVIFFDVGQGDAALVQTAGRAFLVDAGHAPAGPGPGGGALGRALQALGVHRLEALILSHGDADHAGGAAALLSTLAVEALVMPAAARSDPRLGRLAELARSQTVDVVWAARGDRLVGPGSDPPHGEPRLVADVLWPPAAMAEGGLDWNDRSLVVRFDLAGRLFLFTGDIGRRAEAALLQVERDPTADVLKLSHHGSAGATSPAFLAAVGARQAVLSAPCLPTRGLPRREVLARLAESGATLRWTGRDGATVYDARPGGEGRSIAEARPCEGALAAP